MGCRGLHSAHHHSISPPGDAVVELPRQVVRFEMEERGHRKVDRRSFTLEKVVSTKIT